VTSSPLESPIDLSYIHNLASPTSLFFAHNEEEVATLGSIDFYIKGYNMDLFPRRYYWRISSQVNYFRVYKRYVSFVLDEKGSFTGDRSFSIVYFERFFSNYIVVNYEEGTQITFLFFFLQGEICEMEFVTCVEEIVLEIQWYHFSSRSS
jgi:hypothetical protein